MYIRVASIKTINGVVVFLALKRNNKLSKPLSKRKYQAAFVSVDNAQGEDEKYLK